jgi:hypothetical protein
MIDELQLESARDAVGVGAQKRQQPVVIASPVADSVASAIERHARNEHPVDACDTE